MPGGPGIQLPADQGAARRILRMGAIFAGFAPRHELLGSLAHGAERQVA